MQTEHRDILIVGAGIAGICAAYYLQKRCPTRSYAILEARGALGGTWDLFRYPGVRSDSAMHTLGYTFRPWREAKAIADGPAILTYLRDTAAEYGIDRQIRFDHRVLRASWSAADSAWAIEAEHDKAIVRLTCGFLCMASGYYDYGSGYTPAWPGTERFAGRIVHPQAWPEDLDYAGKRVVVIGSGATAVTLVPAMAQRAARVTMLQRSPTYIVGMPSEDRFASWLRRRLPDPIADRLARWKSILFDIYFYNLTRRRPDFVKQELLKLVRQELGPDYDVGTHFTPRYNPWDQRLCIAPDSDFFAAIRSGNVSVVTDQIATFTETGIRLCSGQDLAADIVVTATGLNVKLMSGVRLDVDGAPVDLARTLSYKGMMYSDVPNLASMIGYTNASWTLRCELTAAYICRLLNYMDRRGYTQCTPRRPSAGLEERPVLDLTSGYIQRAIDTLPRQGSRQPWKVYQNYLRDMLNMRFSRVNDGAIEFKRSVTAG